MREQLVMSPRECAIAAESHPPLRPEQGDAFYGYGVVGLPFESGHVLALRRLPSSSIGPGYTSVWHRDPGGRWTIYSTVPPELSCARYFGGAIERNVMSRIEIVWPTPTTLRVEVEQVLSWEVGLRSSVATRLWNRMPASLQGRMLQSPRMAKLIGRMAKTAVRVGRMNLTGLTPNAHCFVAGPGPIWLVANSRAAIDGTDLGEMAPLKEQASIGDLQVPQRGIFTVAGIQMRPPRRRVRAGAMAEGSCRLANCPPHLSLGDHD